MWFLLGKWATNPKPQQPGTRYGASLSFHGLVMEVTCAPVMAVAESSQDDGLSKTLDGLDAGALREHVGAGRLPDDAVPAERQGLRSARKSSCGHIKPEFGAKFGARVLPRNARPNAEGPL